MTDVYFTGIAEWAQVQRPNKFGNWSINLYVDRAQRKAMKEMGLRANAKEGNEEYGDGMFVTFRRPTSRIWQGKHTQLKPPVVVDAKGQPFTDLIGNGSKVTVKVSTYSYQGGVDANGQKYDGGTGARLEEVVINELVPYTKAEGEQTVNTDKPIPEALQRPQTLPPF